MPTDKICVATICQNEIEILPYTLSQSLKHADKVIVINGGTKLSTDGTTEYLNKLYTEYLNKLYLEVNGWKIKECNKYYELINPKGHTSEIKYKSIEDIYANFNPSDIIEDFNESKLILRHGIYGDNTSQNNWDRVQRNAYLEILEEVDWDGWLFLVDADETYTDTHWARIKKYVHIANRNDMIMVRFPYLYFFGDFNHEIHGPDKDTLCHHLSIFLPGFRYLDNSTLLRDISGRCLTHYHPSKIMEVNDIILYHYSHGQSAEKEKQRLYRYYKRGDLGPEVASNIPDNIEEWDWKDEREIEMKGSKVIPFKGQHPDHMIEYINKK